MALGVRHTRNPGAVPFVARSAPLTSRAAVSDTATRADQGPPPSGDWKTDPEGYGAGGFTISSNQFAPQAGFVDHEMQWVPDVFGPNVSAQFDLPVLPDALLMLWATTIALAAHFTGYQLQYNAATPALNIVRNDDGGGGIIASTVITLTAGDTIQLRITPTAVEGWRQSSGVWSLVVSASDTTYRSSQFKVGIYVQNTVARLSNFAATSAVPTTTTINISDTALTLTDTLATKRQRILTDQAVTASDTVATTRTRVVSDTGVSQSDTLATTRGRAIIDTATSGVDTLATTRVRVVADTSVTNTDTIQLRTSRLISDTGVAASDSISRRVARGLTDTGTTNTDTIQLRTTRGITDTGVANTDSVGVVKGPLRVVSDTGVTNTDTVQVRTKRVVSDTSVSQSDAVATRRVRAIADDAFTEVFPGSATFPGATLFPGGTISDTIQLRTTRVITDTGVTNTDTLTRRLGRPLADTGVSNTDTTQLRTTRILADTGVANSDSVIAAFQHVIVRGVSDTGLTVTDSVVTTRVRKVTDQGVTVTDSLTRRVTRVISDQGASLSDTLTQRRTRIVSDTGATITDVAVVTFIASTPATRTELVGIVDTGFFVAADGVGASGVPTVGFVGVADVGLVGVVDGGVSASLFYPATKVAVLGYSNQTSPTDIPTLEASIGRSFHGLRQNQQYTVTSISTAITEFDAGRTLSYRSIQFNTAPGGWAAAAAGTFDSQLVAFCNAVTAANRWTTQNPFWVCLHHEATTSGGVFGTPGYSASDHKAMWQHCVPVMLATGAPIAFAYVGWDRMFVGLNGVGPPTAGQSFDDLDPGVAYYSRIGSDPYNQPDSPGVLRYGTSAATLLEPIRQAALARNMDWMCGEMGCQDGATTQDHVNKAAWLDSLRVYLDGLGTTGPGVCRALLTTQETGSLYNWDSSAEALAAGARFGHDAYYA